MSLIAQWTLLFSVSSQTLQKWTAFASDLRFGDETVTGCAKQSPSLRRLLFGRAGVESAMHVSIPEEKAIIALGSQNQATEHT